MSTKIQPNSDPTFQWLENKFRIIDAFLIPRSHKVIVTFILILLWIPISPIEIRLVYAVFMGSLTLWTYLSVRKYGWMDTITFVGVLPFMLIGAVISRFNSDNKINKPDPNKFAPEANNALTVVINDVYAGKIIDTAITAVEVRFTVETPFGIKLPLDKILPAVATSLHVPVSDISHIDLTERKSYYSFNLSAVRAFELYERSKYEYLTMSGIRDRLLCRLPKGAIQT